MSARLQTSAAVIEEDLARDVGRRLVAAGALDDMALLRAERAWRSTGDRFDLVLTRLGLVPETVLVAELARATGLATIDADAFPADAVAVDHVDPEYFRANRVVPLALEPDRLVVAVDTPFETPQIAALAFLVERPVQRRLATSRDLGIALARLYESGHATVSRTAAPAPGNDAPAIEDVARLKDAASEAPVIKLVQDLIVRAVAQRASDIHLESRPESLCVRFRIDGILHTIERLPLALAPAVVTRVKVVGRLDIAERRLPQDGRIRTSVHGREIDLRVSTVPTIAGESVVLRILDRSAVALDLPALGFTGHFRARLDSALRQPNGIVLVTGPTGSGKTTTLYAALRTLDRQTRKFITVEDPIEYQLSDINQIQVHPGIGLTFASALRSILRQDPDVLMVGEIRDLETAEIAVQAALTGHLVLSTVHTNSAAATLTRLLDMGVENYLLTSSVVAIVAQRLVRRLCRACAAPDETLEPLLPRLVADAGFSRDELSDAPRAMQPVGCPACMGTGYVGRTAIGEILQLTPELKRVLNAGAGEQELQSAAVLAGMRTMYQDGLARVLAAETTLEEVLRATRALD